MSGMPHAQAPQAEKPTSTVIVAVLLGIIIGSAVTFAAITGCGYTLEKKETAAQGVVAAPGGAAPGGPAADTPAGGGNPMGMGAAPMGMGGGPMGMMGGGFGGGGGGPTAKQSLATLVGKLELLTRDNLRIELDADQAAKIVAKLAEFENAEKMTMEEAQKELDELESLLTASQKDAVGAVGLPFGGRGGRGGPGRGGPGGGGPGGGGPGAGGPGGAGRGGMGMGMGRGGPQDPDENPFRQETNQKRLQDILARLKPAA